MAGKKKKKIKTKTTKAARKKAGSGKGAPPTKEPGGEALYHILAATVVLVTFFVFYPALSNYFLLWDDSATVLGNRAIDGLDMGLIKGAFFESVLDMWHPLTTISFALDYKIWGGFSSFGFHLTNNILHSVNALLVFVLSVLLIGHVSGIGQKEGRTASMRKVLIASFAAALLFSLHPLRVESVVWITERKDILFLFFYLLGLIYYYKYAAAGAKSAKLYILTLLFAAASMMSKPMAVTFPMVLILMDFYPLGRFSGVSPGEGRASLRELKKVILEKVPFILLSFCTTLITISFHVKGGSKVPGGEKIAKEAFKILHPYIWYIQKTIAPFNLTPLYYRKNEFINGPTASIIYITLFLVISIFCILTIKRRRYFLTAWCFFILTLLPVIRWFPGTDRFTYLPSIALSLMAGLLVAYPFGDKSKKAGQAISCAVLIVVLALLSYATVKQTRIWKNSVTLWTHQITLQPGVKAKPYLNLGLSYALAGDQKTALKHYTKALEVNPNFSTAHYNRGKAYSKLGMINEAVIDYKKALELYPGHKRANLNLANIYGRRGEYKLAIEHYNRAIRISSRYVNAYRNRAKIYEVTGETRKAIIDFEKVVELNAESASDHYRLAKNYQRIGEQEKAISTMKKAASLGSKRARDYLKLRKIDY
ncbi:MAG: tetratricopeptide repeat protein [Thermodesulfobacteriota bacterium]